MHDLGAACTHRLHPPQDTNPQDRGRGDLERRISEIAGLPPANREAPGPGSPAIDSGDNSSCAPDDLHGAPRPQDGDGTAVCDRGAFEIQP